MRLENGRSARFWSDNWAPLGLVSALRDSSNSRLGIPLNATIASLFRDDHWNLPVERSNSYTHQGDLVSSRNSPTLVLFLASYSEQMPHQRHDASMGSPSNSYLSTLQLASGIKKSLVL